jgi:ubiquinone/menaquinone biosynthesis C-methylase UbiE
LKEWVLDWIKALVDVKKDIEIVRKASFIQIDAIDLSNSLIKKARKNALKANVAHNVRFEIGNAAATRFADNSYDMVLSTGMLHMLRDPVGVLNECHRLLKPGAEAWIYDPAGVSSRVDSGELRRSLTLWERLMFILFPIFKWINPSQSYNRGQLISMLSATDFHEYRIDEKFGELMIRLKKEVLIDASA